MNPGRFKLLQCDTAVISPVILYEYIPLYILCVKINLIYNNQELISLSKLLRFTIEETANYFSNTERTENEEYLLHIILQLGKEYNELIDSYNRLVNEHKLVKKQGDIRRPV